MPTRGNPGAEAMPELKSKIHYPSSPEVAFEYDERARRQIESAFGHELSVSTWLYITSITKTLILHGPGAKDGPTADEVLVKLRDFAEAASDLRRKISGEVP